MSPLDLLDKHFLGAPLTRWLTALAALFIAYLLLSVLQRWLKRYIGIWAAKTATNWDDLLVDLIGRTRQYFLVILSITIAARFVPLNGDARDVLRAILVVGTLIQAGLWGNGLILFLGERYTRLKTSGDVAARATVHALGYAARIALWGLLAVSGLDFFDIRVTALLTGLGIGGVAVALAAQNVLSDLFAAMAIVLDRPFVVGDFIVFDNVKGEIANIGLKTTRIRSLSGEEIVIANSELLKARIRNYRRMAERRVAFTIDVTYDTPPDTVARIPQIIRECVGKQAGTRFDRSHFLEYGDSALRFETVYFVLDRDYNRFADIHQAINLDILRRFAAEKISFAFPTRTVVLQKDE